MMLRWFHRVLRLLRPQKTSRLSDALVAPVWVGLNANLSKPRGDRGQKEYAHVHLFADCCASNVIAESLSIQK